MKLPVSVLVVVHTPQMEVLLLERAQRPGFWQSVTGSLDRPDEALEAAAARELGEETGLQAAEGRLRRWNVAYTFEIYAQWRDRFAPGVTHNTEHLYSFELASPRPVALAPREHTASAWLPWREAARKCFSWSNRDAILMVGAALLAAGCATGDGKLAAHLESGAVEVQECARWYQALDAQIDAAGARDAQAAQVPGFPHLRIDRTLASLADRAGTSEVALRAFGERLAGLDLAARDHELRNLASLPSEAARTQSLRRVRDCSAILRRADLQTSASRAALLAAARHPRSEGKLVPGEQRSELARDGARPRVRYAPPAGQRLPRAVVAGLLGRAAFDPLGQLGLSERELERLALTYAPTLEIETQGDGDRIGYLRWRRGSRLPQLDATEPTVYMQSSYARYGEHLLLQLVYTFWFAEPLAGVLWRVTLAPDGEPLVYDSVHACGGFHAMFPTPRARGKGPASGARPLNRVGEEERAVVTIASATHAVEAARITRDAESLVRYALRPYEELRSLPLMVGGHASVFGAQGRLPGTNACQWGRQPVGPAGEQFDDPALVERRFELLL